MGRLRQTDRQETASLDADSQHECEPEIKYRFNIPRGLSGKPAGADLPTFSPLQGVGQRPGRLGPSGLVQSRLGKRLHYLLLGSPRPQMQGSRLPPGEGSPGHRSRRCPPSFPPSLCLTLPPSLPPSRAAARGALPRATCSGPNPGISEKRKDLLCGKERKTFNCFSFSCSEPGWASLPTSWPRLCPCRGVRGLLPRPRGPPRPAHCMLHTLGRHPRQPKHHSDSRSFLQTQHPVARHAAGLRPQPAPLGPQPKSTGNPPRPCSRARPGHPSLPRRQPGHTRVAVLPGATNLLPSMEPKRSEGS